MNHAQLKVRQGLPHKAKVNMTLSKIRQALNKQKEDKTYYKYYISFSGGRDSMVLMDLVHQVNPTIPVVFCNTGVEWPSVKAMGLKYATEVLKPHKPFAKIVRDYGYPAISKDVSQKLYEIRTTKSLKLLLTRLYGHPVTGNGKLPIKYRYLMNSPYELSNLCCHYMKHSPFFAYEKRTGRVPFIGTMAADSRNRQTAYLDHGCNNLEEKKIDKNGKAIKVRPTSSPMGFWTHEDVKQYAEENNLELASVYSRMEHTGCMFCLFGCVHQEFIKTEIIREVNPNAYRYAKAVGMVEIEKFIRAGGHPTLF